MKKERFIEIVTKISENNASDEDMALFLFHVNSYSLESSEWDHLDANIKMVIKDSVEENILNSIKFPDLSAVDSAKIKPLWYRLVAAVIAIFIVGGLFYYNIKSNNERAQSVSEFANDVAPGRQGATLTLANGKKIRLSDAVNGELAKEAGVVITKAENGELIYEIKQTGKQSEKTNILSTANGETYRLRLPDGSTVWLNSASSLTYSANLLKDGKRMVKLSGEGYFSVAKDKGHPFIVETNSQSVEVLGTEFNLNSYPDEAVVSTALLEGSVRVTSDAKQKLIKPGEQVINDGRNLRIAKADLENITDWKKGDFNFDGVDFRSAMRKIGRWYNVEIIYAADVPGNFELLGLISREKNLSGVLKLIESVDLVKFKVIGKKVYVSKK